MTSFPRKSQLTRYSSRLSHWPDEFAELSEEGLRILRFSPFREADHISQERLSAIIQYTHHEWSHVMAHLLDKDLIERAIQRCCWGYCRLRWPPACSGRCGS